MPEPSRLELQYSFVRGSDVLRDGMFLEVASKGKEATPLFEIFYSDETHEMSFMALADSIPLDIVEFSIARAKRDLPPIDRR